MCQNEVCKTISHATQPCSRSTCVTVMQQQNVWQNEVCVTTRHATQPCSTTTCVTVMQQQNVWQK